MISTCQGLLLFVLCFCVLVYVIYVRVVCFVCVSCVFVFADGIVVIFCVSMNIAVCLVFLCVLLCDMYVRVACFACVVCCCCLSFLVSSYRQRSLLVGLCVFVLVVSCVVVRFVLCGACSVLAFMCYL